MLTIVPITFRAANAFVREHHRHSAPATGCCFAIGCELDGKLVGVAICGRPLARMLQDGVTLEVLRVCTDGAPNACSHLYGACRRIGRAMGYMRIITYTLASEPGTSLLASGARQVATVAAGQWSRTNRPRPDRDAKKRIRWEL